MKRAILKPKIDEIREDPAIITWLEGLKESTKKRYLDSIATFCIITQKTPSELRGIAWKEQEERVPPWQQQVEIWFKKLEEYNNDPINNYSKTTVATRRTNIANFFHFYKLQTPTKNPRRHQNNLKIKNERDGLTKQDLRDALNGAKSFKLKALILTQASSGLALIDVIKLNVEQFYEGLISLDDKHEICRIYQKRTKTEGYNKENYTFISYEAVDLIKKYLELERKKPIEGPLFAASRAGNKRYSEDSYRTAINRLNKALGWYTGEYEYGKLTTHMLRKFFETQLTDAGCISEHLVHMMGWKLPGMRSHYYLAHPEELQKSYTKHLDYLTLENVETVTIDSPQVKELKQKYSELEEKSSTELQRISDEQEEMKEMMLKTQPFHDFLAEDKETQERFKKWLKSN